ncbi:MAG: hypothetical protein AB9834_07930 [Lentimicrobium sp.]
MKKSILRIALIVAMAVIGELLSAQPVPPSGAGHGAQGSQPAGNGAPIGSGLIIMLTMFAAYGGKKAYVNLKQHYSKLEE